MSHHHAVLNVSNLSIQRGATAILHDISWQIQRGEHWTIIGANGAGKTSLLSALTGYLMPSSGDIEVLGQRYGHSDWRELRKRVGIVSSSIRQQMADSETALETVVSGKYAIIDLWGRPTRGDRNAAKRILRQIDCEYLEERPWQVLSQGERQRVLIGRAMMAKPALLILDEPCAGLDPAAREHFLQFLQRLTTASSSPTLILVTHHVEEIQPGFTHALILKAGRVLAAGTKTKVLTSRALTAAFNTPVQIRRRRERFSLDVRSARSKII